MKEKNKMNMKKDNEKELNVNEHLKEMKKKGRKDIITCKIRERESSTRKTLKKRNESEG
jgi:hypothetical protein